VNRTIALAVLALLVGTAGCLGGAPGAATDTPTQTPTDTETPNTGETETGGTDTPGGTPTAPDGTVPETDVGTNPYDCPYLLDAEPATESQRDRIDRTVAYENLTADRQSEFDRARNDTAELETLPEVWGSPVLVTVQGEEYYVVASTC
jgi:hypothetical protein